MHRCTWWPLALPLLALSLSGQNAEAQTEPPRERAAASSRPVDSAPATPGDLAGPHETPPSDERNSDDSPTEGEANPPDTTEPESPPAPDPEPQTPRAPQSPQPGTADEQPSVTPPAVLREAPLTLPEEAKDQGDVVFLVTVGADGTPRDIELERGLSAGANAAARKSLSQWKFAPATRNGIAISARIRVAVAVKPREERPAPVVAPTAKEPELPAPVASDEHPAHDHTHAGDVHMQVTVHGDRPLRSEQRSSSDYFVHRETLEAAPHQEGAEMLRAAPGLTVFRSEGLAQAHSYALRGFDAEHGQDIEFVVGGLPINMPSHIHGQGYADLSFLVGPLVDEISVKEGVSDPRQGDFAVAGTLRLGLGVDEDSRGLQMKSGYGSFDTQKHQIIWAPKEAQRESVGAAQYSTTDGFGERRAGKTASGIVQHRFGEGSLRYRAIGFVHGARGESAGVLRRDDIDSGKVCFHCAYSDATGQAQYALAQRAMAGFFADYRGPAHANGTFGFFVGRDHYRSQGNFTGYLQRSRSLPGVSGRGDLIEQTNDTTTLGISGRYRTEAFEPAPWAHGTVEVGVDGRLDTIAQSQNLLDAGVRNQIWDERVDASISAANTSLWGDLDWQFGSRVQARLGARAAILSYDVEDRLGNFAPLSRPQDQSLPGFQRSSIGATVGPRSSLDVKVFKWMNAVSSYGEGYRSPQARTLADGESAPFAKVRSADGGLRMYFGEPLSLTLTGYYTHLSDDVAFDASEGRLKRIGPTSRAGAVAYAKTRPTEWLLGAFSVTYVKTALLEPPPATADEPTPPFEKGSPLPFVPPLVVRIDASAHSQIFVLAGTPLEGRLGLGATYIAPRPLPFNQSAQPIPLLDAQAGLLWGPIDFNLAGFNLLDLDYAAREYVFVSDWDPDGPSSRTPARHIAAGSPFSVMATLGVTL